MKITAKIRAARNCGDEGSMGKSHQHDRNRNRDCRRLRHLSVVVALLHAVLMVGGRPRDLIDRARCSALSISLTQGSSTNTKVYHEQIRRHGLLIALQPKLRGGLQPGWF
jgi:hypothetical protein